MRLSQGLAPLALLTLLILSACGGSGAAVSSSSPNSTSGSGAGTTPLPTTPQDDVQFSAAAYTVSQMTGSVSISVSRVNGSSAAATVGYATSNGTAVAGQTYTASSGSLSWARGDAAAKTIKVVLSATPFSGAKSFTVMLSNASGTLLGTPHSAVVTVNGSAAAPTGAGTGPAAKLAAKLGLPSRLLLGLSDPVADIQAQGMKVDIYTQYLVGNWPTWNSPPCDYVCVVAQKAAQVGAIPMYVQYLMADNGDGNLAGLTDSTFMASYWARLKTLYQDIAASGKPALVNLEPDFWGYVERQGPSSDPSTMSAVVTSNPDCATLTNNVKGVAGCMIAMARKYAPNKAYVGFPPSDWGGNSNAAVVAFMNSVGAAAADFIIEQTLDRDAGCYEVSPAPGECARNVAGAYWDETNLLHPNFQDHLAEAQAYHTGIGNLPLIWWQTPMGVPSSTPGGSPSHYRDNRVHYFLTHPDQLTAVGGLGVAFAGGASNQTSIKTDSGQFQSLSGSYLASPAALP